MEYDEEKILENYILAHSHKYMTDIEFKTQRAIDAHLKAERSSPKMAAKILEKWGSENDSDVHNALSQGVKQFQKSVRERILLEHPEFINRCPECNKIVRTPKAKQCRWCLYDWHAKT